MKKWNNETQSIINKYIDKVIANKDYYREICKIMDEFATEIHDITCKRMIDTD